MLNHPIQGCRRAIVNPLTVVFLLAFSHFAASVPAGAENHPGDERISLSASNMPLGDVLKRLSKETGYRFGIEDRWKRIPISVTLRDTPLHTGLNRILGKLSYAIVYGSDRRIDIRIFDSDRSPSNVKVTGELPPQPVPRMPPAMRQPRPTVPAPPAVKEPDDSEESKAETPDKADTEDEKAKESRTEQDTEKDADEAKPGDEKPEEKSSDKEGSGEPP